MTDLVRFADEFFIRASSGLADDRTRVLKYGDTFAVFNRFGDIEPIGPSQFGLFHAECRHISRFTMQVNGLQPLLLSSTVRDDNAFLSVDLSNLDVLPNNGAVGNGQSPERGTLHIFRLQFLDKASWHTKVRILNYGCEPAHVSLSLSFDADFADIFEVRGTKRERCGKRLPNRLMGQCPVLEYVGLDGVLRRTQLNFSQDPAESSPTSARFDMPLQPGEEASVEIVVHCESEQLGALSGNGSSNIPVARRESNLLHDPTDLHDCRITTSSEGFNAWITRSTADIRMLVDGNPEGPYPYAGVPWFSTVFGRDGIITAMECLWVSPTLAEGVLKTLAETQATEENLEQDAEPGKILHEMRRGEMAATKEVPFGRYYGSVDATPLFVMLAGAYLERSGNLSFVKKIWPNVKRALDWMAHYGDRDNDGFVEYEKRSERGLVQQGWKDSSDSIFYADGRLAEPPIALCEVQGYVFAAKRAAAKIARALGEPDFAAQLDEEAVSLQVRFEECFWNEEMQTYALALDGRKKQCVVKASNAGHALFCGIANEDHARAAAAVLMSEQMYSGWGVRTLASCERRYNPMSYHNGSVWPHDNAIAAMGFSRYGMQSDACQVLEGIYESSRYLSLQRLPELFCGFHKRADSAGPTHYPVACSPQAWAAGAVFLLLQAALGIRVTAEKEVWLSKPVMPSMLHHVRIDGLKIGNARVNICLQRNEGGVSMEATHYGDEDVKVYERF